MFNQNRFFSLSFILSCCLAIGCASVSPAPYAGDGGATQIKGSGEIQYKSFLGPSKNDKRVAYKKAQINALSAYIDKTRGNSGMSLFNAKKEGIEEQLDALILNTIQIGEDKDKGKKSYKVVVRIKINKNTLDNWLGASECIGEAPNMTFVFVARQQSKVTTDANSTDNVRLADQTDYRVSTSTEVNVAMSNIFSENCYEVIDAAYLEEDSEGLVDVGMIKEDFSRGNDVSPTTIRNAVIGARELEVFYFGLGTLDIGTGIINQSTGLQQVHVTVTGKVLSLKKRFPRTIAAIGPVQYSGTGPTQSVARNNALKLAAQRAAKDLVDQFRNKKIN
ncbi:MAG: hypothetical protein KUG82_16645 [Pseudomonadales bacterium]|nr:hypothetical protein [Pseudomonadales bacterium]